MRMNGQQNQPLEMSYSERLAEIERKIPIFLERIQSYDTLFDMNEKYKMRMDFLSQQNDSLQKKLEEQKKEHEQQINDLTNKHGSACKIIDMLLQSDSHIKKDVEYKHRMILENQDMHMRYIDGIKNSVSEMSSRMSYKQDIDDAKKLNNSSLDLLKNRIDGLSTKFQSVYENVETCFGRLSDIELFVKNEIGLFMNSTNELRENQANDRFTIKSLTDSTMPAIKKEIAAAIDHVKKLIPDIQPLDTIKKDIQDQMQRIELDGKNAVLRAINNEKSVDIMKKQIENIYLLLKKYELNQ